jgi:methanogenic corrinoid protein MtbC1
MSWLLPMERIMSATGEFLLERFVHYVLCDDPLPGRQLIASALANGEDPFELLTHVLWPAAECLQQLKKDGLIATRLFNAAQRALASLIHQLAAQLPREPQEPRGPEATAAYAPSISAGISPRGRLLILSAPGEFSDLGAQLLAALAESRGFDVLFAGAGVTSQELTFALLQLQPDALLIHGSLDSSRLSTRTLLEHLQRSRLRPQLQVAAVGAIADPQSDGHDLGADLVSRHPMEILEMLALCPDYRSPGYDPHPAQSLEMLVGATLSTNHAAVHDFLRSRFPTRLHAN